MKFAVDVLNLEERCIRGTRSRCGIPVERVRLYFWQCGVARRDVVARAARVVIGARGCEFVSFSSPISARIASSCLSAVMKCNPLICDAGARIKSLMGSQLDTRTRTNCAHCRSPAVSHYTCSPRAALVTSSPCLPSLRCSSKSVNQIRQTTKTVLRIQLIGIFLSKQI